MVANFAATSATAIQIFPLFWKAVSILEKTRGLNVISASCDGASSNRKFLRCTVILTVILIALVVMYSAVSSKKALSP